MCANGKNRRRCTRDHAKGADEVVGVDVIPKERAHEFRLLVISENGLGKRHRLMNIAQKEEEDKGSRHIMSARKQKSWWHRSSFQVEEDLIAISKRDK